MNYPSVLRGCFLLVCAAKISAEDLTGTVTDAISGTPIEGATISVEAKSATTGSDGRYTISGLADGIYTVRAEADGYVPQEKSVNIGGGGSTTGELIVAGMFPRSPTAYYDGTLHRIRIYGGGESGRGGMEFTLCTVDGRVAFRCAVSAGAVREVSAQDIAAGKYVWSIVRGRDGHTLANGTMDISR